MESMAITNVRVRAAASTWAVSVVASSASCEAGTALRTARSYQESATIPCCAGQAPVAKVAIAERGKGARQMAAIRKMRSLRQNFSQASGAKLGGCRVPIILPYLF